jgi:hypothetical protein
VTKSSLPGFPDWTPKAVQHEAEILWSALPTEKDSNKAQQVLKRLITDPDMESVWLEIFRKKRRPNNIAPAVWALHRNHFFNPACLTNASRAAALREKARELRKKGGSGNIQDAKFLDFEASLTELVPPEVHVPAEWSEQDCAAQLFLTRAYRIALDYEDPQKVSDLLAKVSKLRTIAEQIRALAHELKSIDIVWPYYAEKLEAVAFDCDEDARAMRPNPAHSPWLFPRNRGDLRQKTIVAKLAHMTFELFCKTLPSTIATVTNVICSCDHDGSDNRPVRAMTRDTIRKMIRPNDLTIRPSFGPQMYPMFYGDAGERKDKIGNRHTVVKGRAVVR